MPVKIRAPTLTKIPHLGLVVECKTLIHDDDEVLLMGEGEQIRAGVTGGKAEERKTNVWRNFMQEIYLCAGQKVLDYVYQSRGEEHQLLGLAGTAACKRDLHPHPLQLIRVS